MGPGEPEPRTAHKPAALRAILAWFPEPMPTLAAPALLPEALPLIALPQAVAQSRYPEQEHRELARPAARWARERPAPVKPVALPGL